ncbi:hypothetical protein [Niabella ginsengisoli]|uniref:Uncharacterized protein n=1 Tax=Niabella ginsengisoli TaxID=522298 RepID=A0ABS9SJ27_9BACT|nr:hypothetical protein [Niabella ginsengisoli]MCH5598359.1 hypothetical protein [Niabella ginsengisoli]
MKISKNLKYFIPLFILLALDLMLMVFDMINFYKPFPNADLYDIETNDSYAEDFQNFKWIIMIIALSLIAMFRRKKGIWPGYWFFYFYFWKMF